MKKFFSFVTTVILIIIAVNFLSSEDLFNHLGDTTVGSENSAGHVIGTSVTTSSPNNKKLYAIGETGETDGIKATLLSVKENYGNSLFSPDIGNIYLICTFEIENTSDEDVDISSLLAFIAFCDDYSVDLSLSAECAVNASTLDGCVASGKKLKGVIGYEVPKDWRNIEIHFRPEVWSGGTLIFISDK